MWTGFWGFFGLASAIGLQFLAMMGAGELQAWEPTLKVAFWACIALSVACVAWPIVKRRIWPSMTPDKLPGVAGITYVGSVGQQGGQTTQNIYHSAPERHIDNDQAQRFVAHAGALSGLPIPVRGNDGSHEAVVYLYELMALLRLAGCTPAAGSEAAGTLEAFKGMHLEVDDPSNLPDTALVHLHQLLMLQAFNTRFQKGLGIQELVTSELSLVRHLR